MVGDSKGKPDDEDRSLKMHIVDGISLFGIEDRIRGKATPAKEMKR